jgi:hypothetical protein
MRSLALFAAAVTFAVPFASRAGSALTLNGVNISGVANQKF